MATFDTVEDTAPGSPRKAGPGRPRTAAKKVVPTTIPDGQLHDALAQNLVFLSMGVGLLDKGCNQKAIAHPDHETCSVAIASQAPIIAGALVEASKKNPALRRILNMIVTTSVFGQVATAMLPVLMTVARNHVSAFQYEIPEQGDGDAGTFLTEDGMTQFVRMNGH